MNTDDYITSSKARRALDLIEFAGKLTSLSSSSAGVTELCSTQHRFVRFLGGQLGFLKRDEVSMLLLERLAFAREFLQAERQHADYIKAAAQAQAQMVCDFLFHDQYTDSGIGMISYSLTG